MWIIYILLNIYDLVMSYYFLDHSVEANPIAKYLWATFGYDSVIYLKCLSIIFVSSIYLYLRIKDKKKSNLIIKFGIIILLYPFCMFIYMLLQTIYYRFGDY